MVLGRLCPLDGGGLIAVNTLAQAVYQAPRHDLEDMAAFVVAECEMVTLSANGETTAIDNDDVISALKAWAEMHDSTPEKRD